MSLINSTSKKTAAIFSYIFLALNSISAIFLTPFLLKYLGVDEYGLYQMVYSIGQYILILDLGISTIMVRYIAEYIAREDYEGMKKFSGMIAILTLLICIVVICIGFVIDYNLENIFTTLSTEDYSKSHWMFNLMIFQFVVTIIEYYIQGAINAYERFVFSKILGIVKICTVFGLTVLFTYLGFGAVGIVMANTIVISIITLIEIVYTFRILRFKIKITYWNKAVMMPAFSLMMAMLLQSVVGNVNSSVDKTILGIMCTPADVTVYSIAATIITLFNTLPTVMSSLFQPHVTRMVVKGTNGSQLTDLVIRVGRWQFIICGAFLAALALFGLDFLNLWVGSRLSDGGVKFALLIMLMILPFNMVPLIQNVCISILNAYDKRMYRSVILSFICVLHIIFSIITIKFWGPIGSPLGTALSFFIGYVIILNIYYSRSLHLEICRMFKDIVNRLWICILSCTVLCLPLYFWSINTWFELVVKGLIFITLLFFSLYLIGFNKEEKQIINAYLSQVPMIRKITNI